MGMITVLMAARYSASPRGCGLLDQAMFTVFPSPGELPGNNKILFLIKY